MVTTDILKITTAPTGALELTKTTAEQVATMIVTPVLDGEVNPLNAYGKIAWLQQVLDSAKKQIAADALNWAERYNQKSFSVDGIDYEVAEVGVKYDYSGNETWDKYQSQIECLRTEQKAAEVILKAQGSYSKSSTTAVKVKLHK